MGIRRFWPDAPRRRSRSADMTASACVHGPVKFFQWKEIFLNYMLVDGRTFLCLDLIMRLWLL